uniref:testican-2-like isoform X2 n=1 Tax=Myxine glutinosa TaxID=7769 RepID=UPI0035902C80
MKASNGDSSDDPCHSVKCGRHKSCQSQGRSKAMCVSHGKSRWFSKGIQAQEKRPQDCPTCPSTPSSPSSPVCGSDGHSYTSKCKLQHQACLMRKALAVQCLGHCPCAEASRNTKDSTPKRQEVCTLEDFLDVATRLKDWFTVLYSDVQAVQGPASRSKHQSQTPRSQLMVPCGGVLAWMFARLDSDGDEMLSTTELSGLQRDKYEHCIAPFMTSCAHPTPLHSGFPSSLSPADWCSCFQRPKPPCLAAVERIMQQQPEKKLLDIPTPSCDEDGYFRAVQCDVMGTPCWCADRYGREITGSRVQSTPICGDHEGSGDWASGDWSDAEDAPDGEMTEELSHKTRRSVEAAGGEGDEEGPEEDSEDEEVESEGEADGGYIW